MDPSPFLSPSLSMCIYIYCFWVRHHRHRLRHRCLPTKLYFTFILSVGAHSVRAVRLSSARCPFHTKWWKFIFNPMRDEMVSVFCVRFGSEMENFIDKYFVSVGWICLRIVFNLIVRLRPHVHRHTHTYRTIIIMIRDYGIAWPLCMAHQAAHNSNICSVYLDR